MKKKYHHSTFVQYKKNHINLFLDYSMKTKFNKKKEKNWRGKKIKNILKGKKLKEKKLVWYLCGLAPWVCHHIKTIQK